MARAHRSCVALWALVIAALWLPAGVLAQSPAATQSRGELLYTTHCIACHTSEIHWRDKSRVTDWSSLRAQVNRWQGEAKLGWSDADIMDVARYLNQLHYRLDPAAIPIASAGRAPVQ
jgi:mono/diheme cytochrome c family protein